jgi:hypothetical protein
MNQHFNPLITGGYMTNPLIQTQTNPIGSLEHSAEHSVQNSVTRLEQTMSPRKESFFKLNQFSVNAKQELKTPDIRHRVLTKPALNYAPLQPVTRNYTRSPRNSQPPFMRSDLVPLQQKVMP